MGVFQLESEGMRRTLAALGYHECVTYSFIDAESAALFGGLHPLTTIPASFLFGALLVGANKLQRAVQVPAALIGSLNGLVVIFVVSTELIRTRLSRRRALRELEKTSNPIPVESGHAR